MTTVYFNGAEQKGWSRLLVAEGVRNLGISFTYYHRKVSRKNWVLPEFPDGTSVLLDSGGFGANKNPDPGVDWLRYEEDYVDFVEHNAGSIDLITEFDMLTLGLEHTQEMREQFWSRYEDKFVPIWHPQHGQEELEHLARRYDRVGIPGPALNDTNWLGPRINSLSRQHGTKFHGLALTRPDVLANVHFDTAASTSWLSPSKFGDSLIFDGQRLRRYPKRYKEQARRRHKMLFSKAGFDAQKILDDDPTEVTRFSIWSWLQWEQTLAERSRLTHRSNGHEPAFALEHLGPVDRRLPVKREGTAILPVAGIEDDALTPAPDRTIRVCNSCYVASNCPGFVPDAECAYRIPIQLRTRDELLVFMHGVIEMQSQRVMFGRFIEEVEGGYADPNLSNEIDRLMKLVTQLRDIEDNRDSLKINVEARAGAGMLSRIFGESPASTPLRQALGPAQTDQAIATVIDVDPFEEHREPAD
jgi:hypothetical protein